EYGADILRLWVAQSDYTVDLRIGKEILKGVADSYRRLRNTMRYMLGALKGFSEAERVEAAEMPELERWVLHRLAELDAEVRAGYEKYDFQGVFQKLFTFATTDLSAVYFDIRKDALYCDAPDSARRRACRTVMDILFHRLTTWLAPVLVFTMEEVWLERFPGEESSIHLADFPVTPKAWLDDDLGNAFAYKRLVRKEVTETLEQKRQEKAIGSSLEAHPIVYFAGDAAMLDHFGGADAFAKDFADLCITSGMTIKEGRPHGAPLIDGTLPHARYVEFHLAKGAKCERCWRVLPDVGTHKHPGTCKRCSDALG
ncbi:MAG: isoleucine--tRNA ligase, partial [Rhodobacter sp.]|nr:isoleucine--tRNA ligase [Rhodobacter sp.]